MKKIRIRNRELNLTGKTMIMGVLNCTPDSFSDGGHYCNIDDAVSRCLQMLDEGADIIDIGGESTRPNSDSVASAEELSRVIPVIKKVKSNKPESIVSIDTRKPEVAEEAVRNGADIINDVSGLKYSVRTADIAAKHKTGLVLMHMRGTPKTMQKEISYSSLLNDIRDYLVSSVKIAKDAGVEDSQIIVDPGIGFGKTLAHNLEILSNITFFKELGYPVLVGPSRKAFIGSLLNEPDPLNRDWGTAGAAAALALQNTDIVRLHNVKNTLQTLKIFETVLGI
ncbi:MAG: dihydropteroate synthase [Victivallales bacterium]|nr:dihydropteroate synthase [Victivallales bacterium]MCF7888599.1 dihydropteroate synthase [Victivallales bacterium]